MKKISPALKFVPAIFLVSILLFACNKNNGYVDINYPETAIYLSQSAVANVAAGANGVYTVTPKVPGRPQRFSIDNQAGKLNVGLGITRAGVTTNGAFTVSISANADTVNKLIAAGKFTVPADPAVTTELLPATAYTLPAAAELADGSLNAGFPLAIDLNFLTNSFSSNPKKQYAVAVTIFNSGKQSIVNPTLSTVVILIDTRQVIAPAANFTSYVDRDIKTAFFMNTSGNGITYSWNYGDGPAMETAISPSHIYAAAGTYIVTLTATGILSNNVSVKTASVTIP